jgi:membrane AbrB-like protein
LFELIGSEIGGNGAFQVIEMGAPTINEVLLFMVVTLGSVYLAVKGKIPTPYLVGPILGCATFVIAGFTPFSIPEVILIASQLFLGIHVGIMVDPKKLSNWKRFGVGAMTSSVTLLLSTILIAALLVWVYPISLGTAFLSSAPGGVAEMGLTAISIGADLSIVTGFQMFRIFFILFNEYPFYSEGSFVINPQHEYTSPDTTDVPAGV